MTEALSLAPLSAVDCDEVVRWRNQAMEALRTPYFLTTEMQQAFYRDVVCDRRSDHRYWAIGLGHTLIGMGGLTYIQWENGIAEIALLLDPAKAGQGYGEAAVDLILEMGFNRMRLLTIFGECYDCNPAVKFWRRMSARHLAIERMLPRRKWWDGQLWDAYHFSFTAESWMGARVPEAQGEPA